MKYSENNTKLLYSIMKIEIVAEYVVNTYSGAKTTAID